MNSARLREIVDLLIEREAVYNIQKLLTDMAAALANLSSQPAEPSYQKTYAEAFTTFSQAVSRLEADFKPAQIKLLEEIKADRFFSHKLVDEIASWIAENPATPSVAQGQLSTLVKERQDYLNRLDQISLGLEEFGIETYDLKPGEAEIGFLLPRSLFNNQLDGLLAELREVRLIIRAFSELATGSVEEIEVKQISTSDPLFIFGMDPATIIALGAAISWALGTLKQVLEIRKLWNATNKISDFDDDPVEKLFQDKMDKKITASVETELKQLVSAIQGGDARKNEQESHIKMALESVLARVDRGMTVEIRLLPPVQDPDKPKTAATVQFDNLSNIASQLTFPVMEGRPIVQLPPPIERAEPGLKRRRRVQEGGASN